MDQSQTLFELLRVLHLAAEGEDGYMSAVGEDDVAESIDGVAEARVVESAPVDGFATRWHQHVGVLNTHSNDGDEDSNENAGNTDEADVADGSKSSRDGQEEADDADNQCPNDVACSVVGHNVKCNGA